MKKRSLILFFSLFLFLFVNDVYAQDGSIDLMEWPENVGEKLGIGTFAGGILLGIILEAVIMFPIVMIARRRGTGFMAELLFGIAIFGFCVAVGWFPIWFIIILTFLVAILFANKIKDVIT